MNARAPLIVAVLALAGCTGVPYHAPNYDWSDLGSDPREFFNLNPPVRIAAGEPIASPVVLRQGQALIVRVPEDPATGYTWRLRPLPAGPLTAPVQHDYTAKAGTNPASSTDGEATFRLRAVAAGTQAVTLDYVKAGSATPEKSVAFDVAVR
jgi:inhibitor of cysteine peptidase